MSWLNTRDKNMILQAALELAEENTRGEDVAQTMKRALEYITFFSFAAQVFAGVMEVEKEESFKQGYDKGTRNPPVRDNY